MRRICDETEITNPKSKEDSPAEPESSDSAIASFFSSLWKKGFEDIVIIGMYCCLACIIGYFVLGALGLIRDCQYELQDRSNDARAYFKRQELESRRQARRYRYPPRRARTKPSRKSRPKAHSRRNNAHPDDPFYNLTVVESPPLSR